MTDIIRTVPELRQKLKNTSGTLGFVPTMGALHAGHVSLVTLAKEKTDYVAASIFVNPTQFGPQEDFNRYPRQEAADIELLTAAGTDIIFIPSTKELYPEGSSTQIDVGYIGTILEGAVRPHFFNGVALIVSKLLMLFQPTLAIFGEKDYQQLVVIQKLVRELMIPTTIIAGSVIRQSNGLAMSSRNAYLTEKEQQIAPALYRILETTKTRMQQEIPVSQALDQACIELTAAGFDAVDYFQLRHEQSLEPLDQLAPHARLLAAVRFPQVRLIDTLAI